MEKEMLTLLLQKYIIGSLMEPERKELTTFISKKQNKEVFIATLEELLAQETTAREFDEKHHMPLLTAILKAETITEGDEDPGDAGSGKRSLLERIGLKKGSRH
jgi:hypothetical protein